MMRPEYLLSTLIVITRVLEMHPTKTKIAYCKDKKRGGKSPNVRFDFLGYCFRPRMAT